jgi:VWFA-related protein
LLASTCVVLVAAARAQTPQPVFRGGVDLVTLDVTVVDKDGQPIRGLTAEDFVVTLEKQPRPVRALDFLEFGSATASSAEAPQTTNQISAAQPTRHGGRMIVLLFDDLSYRPGPGKAMLVSAERMLGSFGADDLIGITTTSGLGPTVNPTLDRSAVVAALHDKKMIGRNGDITAPFFIGASEAMEIDRGFPQNTLGEVAARECPLVNMAIDPCTAMLSGTARAYAQQIAHTTSMQLAQFQKLMELLKTAPAPKIVITMSRGVAIGNEPDLLRQLEPLGRSAAENGVQFYAMSEIGASVDVADSSETRAEARREESRFLNTGAQTVAENAGGEAFLVVGTPDRFFRRIEMETSGFYRLGIEAPVLKDKQRYLATKVSVNRSGATVRVNREALMASIALANMPIADQMKTMISQGGTAFGVPITVGTAQRRNPTTQALELGVNVQVPANVHGPLIVMFGLVNSAGEVVKAGRGDAASPPPGEDYQVAFPVPLEPGKFQLRLVVADAQGNIGSVERTVTGDLAHLGGFSVSDLFTMWAGADHKPRFLALERLPEGASTLGASLELYPDNPSAAPDVIVRFDLLAPGSNTAVLEREITPSVVGTVRSAIAELPVDDLQSGTYLVRATVVERGVETGVVTTTIRKGGG